MVVVFLGFGFFESVTVLSRREWVGVGFWADRFVLGRVV